MTLKQQALKLYWNALFMISTMRFSLLAAFGSMAIGTVPVMAAAQSAPMQIVPANPVQNTPVAPDEPALSDPALPNDSTSPDSSAPTAPSVSEFLSPQPLVEPAAAGTTTNYSDTVMSVDFPPDWKAEVVDENIVMIANVTTEEANLVATQVVQMAAPTGAVVDANIDSFIEEGSAVGRYRTVTIDGRKALVMWLSERPDDSLTNAIATFIDYGNNTVLIFSRYSPDNAVVEDDILRLHSSYHSLTAASADAAPADAAPGPAPADMADPTEDVAPAVVPQ